MMGLSGVFAPMGMDPRKGKWRMYGRDRSGGQRAAEARMQALNNLRGADEVTTEPPPEPPGDPSMTWATKVDPAGQPVAPGTWWGTPNNALVGAPASSSTGGAVLADGQLGAMTVGGLSCGYSSYLSGGAVWGIYPAVGPEGDAVKAILTTATGPLVLVPNPV